ncbi:SFT2 domain-containing protein [Capsaspora owczarzaki ATCC 30864]|uniref:Vesicle transport protein n=1 Tax=Capsaspora owczarzaki (strain ATCC 30864) TaxID=595528 RepID=A0A0D2UD20_CAPO3|nr:SFT2 domain-containing protein [Capsaspora owczarzaki ATCC 30864]KJE92961.1 SFT2 domain-containing protein, variant [Capsaspora owczarzaki ATCC 30864]|eukprot:XP_004363560.2 SFT2 domain-containing protein [Capsaspora owczarzaki ATCC 30864]
MNSLKGLLSSNDEQEKGILSEANEAVTLSRTTRIYGFVGCFAGGFILTILSTIAFAFGKITLFALAYTAGNILSLMSTGFLVGPVKQIKNMFEMKRIWATIAVILFIGLTLCAALWWHNVGLTVLFVICEFCAMFWYALSYIPYARDAAKKCFGSCLE